MYCPDGLPVHYDTNVEAANLQFGYSFYKITPSVGFSGGTLLTIHTSGFGEGFDLSDFTLAYYVGTPDWTDFCFDLEWFDIDKGMMTCRHDSSIYPTSSARVALRHTWHTGSRFNCYNANSIPDNCNYHADEKGISIDSVEISGSPANTMALSLTQDNIGFEDYSIAASFRGVNPDRFDGAELIFGNGVPTTIDVDQARPILIYKGTYSDGTPAEVIADYSETF
jgi:hypothetical protein